MGDWFEAALTRCYYCGKVNTVVTNEVDTPEAAAAIREIHWRVTDLTPCPECREYMEMGIILITIDPVKSGKDWEKERIPNPYRTGGFFVVEDELLEKVLSGESDPSEPKKRWMFIEHEVAERLGFFKMAIPKRRVEE